MQVVTTSLKDVVVLEPKVFGDDRGFFFESFNEATFADLGLPTHFKQDNHSGSRKGVLRGLHYQLQQAQGKLVRALKGEIFDVAVDIRRDSPQFGQWFGTVLSAENKRQLWIPAGFAHGFQVLTEFAEVAYKATEFYSPSSERSILWNDPTIGIKWPLEGSPALSSKDEAGTLLQEAEVYEISATLRKSFHSADRK